jgi:hypothetical protein
MNPHRTHRPDSNRDEIVDAFEKLGWKVFNTGMIGEGFPDVVVAFDHSIDGNSGHFYKICLVEIKNGNGKYTPKEQKFMDEYPGLVTTVRSVEDVQEMFG